MIDKGRQILTDGRSARLERRRLLRGLASGGAAALLAAGSASSSVPEEPAAAATAGADPRRIGFRETEHTRWYYRRARW